MTIRIKKSGLWSAVFIVALSTAVLPYEPRLKTRINRTIRPPEWPGSATWKVRFLSSPPASDWVQAVPNRPMTTGDKLWADKDSRAELQLGSAVIRLSENTGFSFLNLDDNTAQIQLTSGALNIRVRRLDQDDVFEVDTPNLAFTISQPGSYRRGSQRGRYVHSR